MRPWRAAERSRGSQSYGPEMRGGTAHCTVIVADEPIGSPLVRHPDYVIAMNLPSVDKYAPLVRPGGILLADDAFVAQTPGRQDITTIAMPAHTIAMRCGDQRLVNIAMLGALMECSGLLPLSAIEQALRSYLPERHQHLLEANVAALHEGAESVRKKTDEA